MPAAEEATVKHAPLDVVAKGVLSVLSRLPEGVQRRIAGDLAVEHGTTVHPEVGMALRLLNAVPASSFETLPLEQARAQIDAEAWVFGKRTEVGRVEDLSIPTPEGSVPARRYDPREDGPGRAVLVYFHGGGFVLGGLESADSVCRFLCARANITVLAVDYRLAPEHSFPAAPDDALAAYRWAVQQAPGWGIGPDRVLLGGDSAGGNLTIVTAMRVRDARRAGEDLPAPMFQVAFFPVTDMAHESDSYERFADGYFLTRDQMRWYIARYLPDAADRTDPHASPLLADDLGDLGPAYIGVSGFDPLREEGLAYGRRAQEAGNDVEVDLEPRHIHGYVNATGVGKTSVAALEKSVDAIRRRL